MSTISGRALYRWWLRLQIGIGVLGAAAGVSGMALDEEFLLGAGVGLLLAALLLRFGRRAAPDAPRFDEGGGGP